MARLPKDYTKEEQKEDRKFVFILYPDSTSYDCELLLSRLQYYWTKYYCILHDRDVYDENDYDKFCIENKGKEPEWKIGDPKKPHYHVVVYNDSPVMLGRALTKAGLDHGVFRCSNLKSAVQYLIHQNNPNKFQYSKEEIITNADDLDKQLRTTIEAEDKAALLIDAIQSDSIATLTKLAHWALQHHCWDEFRRGQHIYTALLNEKLYYSKVE